MRIENWNKGWKFWADRDAFSLLWNVPDNARELDLPHDAMIENEPYEGSPNNGNTGYRDGGNYSYSKQLFVPAEACGTRTVLQFDGVYRQACVYVNAQLAGRDAQGYGTFYVDISDFLNYGADNEIRVQVKNAGMSNSRWYSGSGIYRDVWLLQSGNVFISPDGVEIVTEDADDELAVIRVRTELVNLSSAKRVVRLWTAVSGGSSETDGEEADITPAGSEESVIVLNSGERRTVTQRIAVPEPLLWSDENPALYVCESTLFDEQAGEEEILDVMDTTFGIRVLKVDALRGLRVNGRTVKLRGACVHHDSGLLGAATYEEAQYRQVAMLKEAGFNAIRMSHHPMAPAMLKACDALGVYVMDEFSDMWTRTKSDLDYAIDFGKWWRDDVARMVRKDRNHPSVVLYSIGNEIPEICSEQGSHLAGEISDLFRTLDPTRFTTAGINGAFAAGDDLGAIIADIMKDEDDGARAAAGNINNFLTIMDTRMNDIVTHPLMSRRLEYADAAMDIIGYNYMTARYEGDLKDYPNRVIVGSETYPPQIAWNWSLVEKQPNVIGDFTWTGWDYIGEAGVGIPAYKWGDGGFGARFPAQLAYCGDIDLTGFRRPASYFREAVFGLSDIPYIAVQDPAHYGEFLIKTPWVISDTVSTWNWRGSEGKQTVVEIYSRAEEVELFVNGVSLGRKPAGPAAGFRTLFEAVYEPGVITAVAYEGGREIGVYELRTAEEEIGIELEEDFIGNELIYLNVLLTDRNGVTATDRDRQISVSVEGDAVLLGVGSGDPKPAANYNTGCTTTWNGRAQAILKRTGDGAICVKARAEGLDEAEISL